MRYIPISQQQRHTAAEAQTTATQAERNAAAIDYIAMMTDIDIDNDDEEAAENE